MDMRRHAPEATAATVAAGLRGPQRQEEQKRGCVLQPAQDILGRGVTRQAFQGRRTKWRWTRQLRAATYVLSAWVIAATAASGKDAVAVPWHCGGVCNVL